nr:voltage-dependent P/Q-type calcium channel subunit alpha-1A-like [Dermacentor andersoni]
MNAEMEAPVNTVRAENGAVRSAYGDPEISQDVPKSVSGNANNHHAPVINIDPGVESGVLLRVPDLPFSRGTSSAESLGATPNQFLNLPSPAEHRRHSMQDGRSPHNHHHHRRHRDRKRSCPDVRSSADRRRRGSRSPMAPQGLTVSGGVDSMSVTPSSSRRSSASSLSRRSSRDSECCPHSRRSSRADDGSRRSSKCDDSRRSSRATDDTGGVGHSSRRSSRSAGDDERRCSEDRYHHHHQHQRPHHSHRRESSLVGPEACRRKGSSLLPPDVDAGSRRASKAPSLLVTDEETGQQRKPDDELDSPKRRIIIFVISSVACFILFMSVVLIAVTLTISPAIDNIGE